MDVEAAGAPTKEVVLPKYVEDIDLVADKETNHPDSTNKVKTISPRKSAGYCCSSVNAMSTIGKIISQSDSGASEEGRDVQ